MKNRSEAFKYLYFLIAGGLCLMLASRSSFLYPFNNWDDANSYLTMGKALFHGKLLYRDVFDQKGPYLYFLYGLAYLVSHTTFAGVFLLELLLGMADIVGYYRICRLYASELSSVVLAPVAYASLLASRSFWWGGAAEEICLPFLIWGLYLLLNYLRAEYLGREMPLRTVFFGGVLAGITANIKFTLLGFFLAWMLLVWISFLSRKDVKGAFRACGVFLAGMAAPFLPWLLYFGLRGGLYEWYWGYVYVNVFVYSDTGALGAGLYEKGYELAKLLYELIPEDWQYFIFVLPGLYFAIFAKKQRLLVRLAAPVLFLFLFLGIFGGGRELPYYSLPLAIFAVFGTALLGAAADRFGKAAKKGEPILAWAVLCAVLSLALVYLTSMNISYLRQKKEELFLFRFRDEVLSEEEPTLLNVGCLDAGLYTLCDIVPNCRYFQTQTLHIEDKAKDPYEEQERYVREGLTDFVLARDSFPQEIYERYELIDSEEYGWDDLDFMYYLFRKVK